MQANKCFLFLIYNVPLMVYDRFEYRYLLLTLYSDKEYFFKCIKKYQPYVIFDFNLKYK